MLLSFVVFTPLFCFLHIGVYYTSTVSGVPWSFCPFFLLAMVFSVLLRITASDYPFDILITIRLIQ
jgi:uncharacterized membrane protein